MRLVLYAHYSRSNGVALYVPFYLRKLRELGFQICFISNSRIPDSKKSELQSICERIIERENIGYDFSMWQAALAEYETEGLDELLLTNSSIIGPLQPLAPLWTDPRVSGCDFWGLTDNDDFAPHLQTFFVVFGARVLQSPCFMEFWRSILPFNDKEQMVYSHEVGLTRWLEEHRFRWKALLTQENVRSMFWKRRSFVKKIKDRILGVGLPQNTTMLLPDLLLESGMPFLKAALLTPGADQQYQVGSEAAFRLLEGSSLPEEVLDELRGGTTG